MASRGYTLRISVSVDDEAVVASLDVRRPLRTRDDPLAAVLTNLATEHAHQLVEAVKEETGFAIQLPLDGHQPVETPT